MSETNELEVYQEGRSPQTYSFTRGLKYVSTVCTDGMMRIVDRLYLEDHGIYVREVPVGGTTGVRDLLNLFNKARQGFRLLAHMHMSDPEKIDPEKFLNEVGIPKKKETEKPSNSFCPSKDIVRGNDEMDLSVTIAFNNTLRKLAAADTVNFYYLGIVPQNSDTHVILNPSFWSKNQTPETLWATIGQIDTAVRAAVLQRGLIENSPLLYQAAHFLAAAISPKQIA